MIAAISTPVSQVPGAVRAETGWAFQRVPNLSRETRQRLGKAKAGWTFDVICTELGYATYRGRANWEQQRLGIGLRAIARESGQDVRKVRRDVAALQELGLIAVLSPPRTITTDPATGRIVSNAKGRAQEVSITLTITPAVLRPPKGQRGAMGGTTVEPAPAPDKGHGGTTVRECLSENFQRTPDGPAAGAGRPQAEPDTGLTAGEAGGHPAAKAAQEETPILPVNAGRDAPPELPPDRIVGGVRTVPVRRPYRPRRDEPAPPRQTWTPEKRAAYRRQNDPLERDRLWRWSQQAAHHLGIQPEQVQAIGRRDPQELRRMCVAAGYDEATRSWPTSDVDQERHEQPSPRRAADPSPSPAPLDDETKSLVDLIAKRRAEVAA